MRRVFLEKRFLSQLGPKWNLFMAVTGNFWGVIINEEIVVKKNVCFFSESCRSCHVFGYESIRSKRHKLKKVITGLKKVRTSDSRKVRDQNTYKVFTRSRVSYFSDFSCSHGIRLRALKTFLIVVVVVLFLTLWCQLAPHPVIVLLLFLSPGNRGSLFFAPSIISH